MNREGLGIGAKKMATAQTMMEGMRIYYNFIRPHMALKGKTPAERARIVGAGENSWQFLIQKSAKVKSEY